MTSKEALEKLDHTICLNTGIKWGVDDLDKIDCQTQEEAIECIDTIRKDLEILKKYIYNERNKGVTRK